MKKLGLSLVLLTIFVPLLLGCPMSMPPGATRPPEARDLAAADLVMAGAARRGLNVSGRCADERRSRFVMVEATDAVMRQRTGYCVRSSPVCEASALLPTDQERFDARARAGCLLGKCVGGSMAFLQDDVWPANLGRWRVEIYRDANQPDAMRMALGIHEMVHWILACSGSGFGEDGSHSAPGFWEYDGPTSLVLEVQAAFPPQ